MKKKGVISEYLPWLLIGLGVLAILMITIFILKDKVFSECNEEFCHGYYDFDIENFMGVGAYKIFKSKKTLKISGKNNQ